MPGKLSATDVFTPNDFPEHTYVARVGEDLEDQLNRALTTPKVVASISGPSKSGKTVLAEKLIGKDNLIQISGAEVLSGDDLWKRVLAWMDVPNCVASQTTTSSSHKTGFEAGGSVKMPLFAEGTGRGNYDYTRGGSEAVTETRSDTGITKVASEIGDSEYVVFLDDFHYIPKEAQTDVAKHIKAAAEQGIRICTATVPHRADDVVRTNHELRGRLAQIDTSFWTAAELAEIAIRGFSKLGADITLEQATKLAEEACGSPQLMQRICLDVSFDWDLREEQSVRRSLELERSRLMATLERSSTFTDFGAMVANMHQGPKTRGTERRIHQLVDGSEGDVYRVLLLAMARGDAAMSLPYTTLMERIEDVCTGDGPSPSSIVQACQQLSDIADRIAPSERVLEWDRQELTGTLSVVNPYFLFYLRRSRKLERLGAATPGRVRQKLQGTLPI